MINNYAKQTSMVSTANWQVIHSWALSAHKIAKYLLPLYCHLPVTQYYYIPSIPYAMAWVHCLRCCPFFCSHSLLRKRVYRSNNEKGWIDRQSVELSRLDKRSSMVHHSYHSYPNSSATSVTDVPRSHLEKQQCPT